MCVCVYASQMFICTVRALTNENVLILKCIIKLLYIYFNYFIFTSLYKYMYKSVVFLPSFCCIFMSSISNILILNFCSTFLLLQLKRIIAIFKYYLQLDFISSMQMKRKLVSLPPFSFILVYYCTSI